MKNMYQDIPDSETWQTIKPFTKACQMIRKLYWKKMDGEKKRLLRISDISLYEQKKYSYKPIIHAEITLLNTIEKVMKWLILSIPSLDCFVMQLSHTFRVKCL